MIISVNTACFLCPLIDPLCFSVFQYHGVGYADSYTELGIIRSGHGHWSGESLPLNLSHLQHYVLHFLHTDYYD